MEDQEYLEPGFDPSVLTMPKLRSILVAHGVEYPASSKKSQLIDIFNENILSQARRLRAANARVKRTSRGIEDVPSRHANDEDEDEDEEGEEPAGLKSVTRTSRRSTRARTEEALDVAPTPRSMRHATAPPESLPRRSSSKRGRVSDETTETPATESRRPASRKSRVGPATPAPKQEVKDEGDSPFSSDNVFQSAGSPPAPSTTDRRRTTMSATRTTDRGQSREVRRRTEEHRPSRQSDISAVIPSRKSLQMPVSSIRREEPDDVETTEEFTPEEQQALTTQPSGTLIPTRRKTRAPSNSPATLAPAAIITALLAALAVLWRQEKLQVGYCGVGQPSYEIAGTPVPEWADFLRPQCEPCPPHAYCQENLQTECEPGFILTPHPLSAGGVAPLPPTCEPDSAKARKVQAVKERAVEELREQNAKYECGEAAKPDLKETELRKAISTQRRKGMTDEEFEDLWASALGEIQSAEEVVSGSDSQSNPTLRSNSLARLPLTCSIRRSLRETLRQYIRQLVIVVFVLSSAAYGRYSLLTSQEMERKAKELASLTLRKLSEQAALHAADPEGWKDTFVSVAQLRDDVLRDEFSNTRKQKLWDRVQRKVERNSNVRPMVREGRSGEVGRVWEWIGAVAAIEGTPGSHGALGRRQSGGFRDPRGEIAGERLIEPASVDRNERERVVKWEEGKTYY